MSFAVDQSAMAQAFVKQWAHTPVVRAFVMVAE